MSFYIRVRRPLKIIKTGNYNQKLYIMQFKNMLLMENFLTLFKNIMVSMKILQELIFLKF